jgi:phosphoglycolate phosphatase
MPFLVTKLTPCLAYANYACQGIEVILLLLSSRLAVCFILFLKVSDMSYFQGIVFDFDGTLAHCQINFALMKRKIAALASGFMDRDVVPDSLPALEWIDTLVEDIQLCSPQSVVEFQSRVRLLLTAIEMKAAEKGHLFPRTRSILGALNGVGVRIGIITRNCTPGVLKIFPDLREFCQVFLPREDVKCVKPHPHHLLTALDRLKIPPSKALLIGDHRIDIEAALKAEVCCGGVATGDFGLEDLRHAGAHFVARDLDQMIKCLVQEQYLPPLANDGA